jgi:hypothetical protein
MARSFLKAIVTIFSRETLEFSSPAGEKRERSSFFAWLLKPERLSAPAVSVPPHREPFWK